jgi:glycine/D-amino acid oxidase-like deaminating enzyme
MKGGSVSGPGPGQDRSRTGLVTVRDTEWIIVGGGAVGCAVALALAEAGHRDVLVIEQRDEVGQETTSQGAGLCGQVRDTVERTRLAMHSVATFRRLQAGSVKPDWCEVGSLRLAFSEARCRELEHLHRVAGEAGLETHLLAGHDVSRHWPVLDASKVRQALWCPSDGHMTPASVTASYRFHAETLGVRFATSTRLEGIVVDQGRVRGVRTSRGDAACRFVVNAAGAHAYHVARMAGLELPVFPVRHEYFVTVPLASFSPTWPCLRIPEWTLYARVRDGGLLLGGWEPRALGMDPRLFGPDEAPPPVRVDAPVLESFAQMFGGLFPGVESAGQAWVGRGWPTFTPDGKFLVGESRALPGLAFATGCNAHGISGSGGLSRLFLEAMFDPAPGAYARSLSPDRFLDAGTTSDWGGRQREAIRVYETYYGV